MDLVTLAIEVVFGLVFVAALVGYLRRRHALSRDVMLVFSAMAVLFIPQVWQVAIGPPPAAVTSAATVLLLAQPLLTLRVARRLGPMPRWTLPVAFLALVATAIPLVLLRAGEPAGVPEPVSSTRTGIILAAEEAAEPVGR